MRQTILLTTTGQRPYSVGSWVSEVLHSYRRTFRLQLSNQSLVWIIEASMLLCKIIEAVRLQKLQARNLSRLVVRKKLAYLKLPRVSLGFGPHEPARFKITLPGLHGQACFVRRRRRTTSSVGMHDEISLVRPISEDWVNARTTPHSTSKIIQTA